MQIRRNKTQGIYKLTNKKVGKVSVGRFIVCYIPVSLPVYSADYTAALQALLLCDPAAHEVSSTFMRWTGPEQSPKSLYMKENMFAMLPLNGLSAEQWREEEMKEEKNRCNRFVEDLSLNSEQQVLPVLLNMN